MTETAITDPREIEQAMRDETATPATHPRFWRNHVDNDGSVVPEFLRHRDAQTVSVQIDGSLPIITLFRALAAHGISVINTRAGFVMTQRPEAFR